MIPLHNTNMTVAEFVQDLGEIFEKYLNQDSGNRSYSVKTQTGRKWIKILDSEKTPLPDIQNLIRFYNNLANELIPGNWELYTLTDGIVIIHDWVPGSVLYSPDADRNAPESAYQRFMRLPFREKVMAYNRILEFFVELENLDIIVEDFYDGCIIYDFDNKKPYLCDLDHIHSGEYPLTKDRQYGSTRFMAPEEFEKGSIIDKRTNVYTMGAAGFVLLNSNRREKSDWNRSEILFKILYKATSQEKNNRFQSINEMHKTWQKEFS